MYLISLLVHEQKEVILDQLLNIKKYFSNAKVIIHLSKGASFSLMDLELYLKTKVDNYYLNPEQVDTSWGKIILAHFSNIKYAYQINKNGYLLFHSSNDMFIKPGVESYLQGKEYLFNQRVVNSIHTYWWVGRVAKSDSNLMRALRNLGVSQVVGTQIEGSMFKLETLIKIIEICNKYNVLDNNLHYPREEIVFSSFANALNIKADGLPYVFSEVHRFDRVLWRVFIKYKWIYSKLFMKNIINTFLFKSKFYKITAKDVNFIKNNNYDFLKKYDSLSDGDEKWEIFDCKNIYAVKRVERDINNKLRKYIRGLE